MRDHRFARMRSVACLMLLLALGAALLPAHSASAEEQVVVIPKEEMQVSLLQSLWQQAEGEEEQSPRRRVEDQLVNEIVLFSATEDEVALREVIDTFRSNYRAEVNRLPNASYEQSAYLGLLAAAKIPALEDRLRPLADSVLSNWLLGAPDLPVDSKDQIGTGFSRAFTSEEFAQLEAAQKRRVVQEAGRDPQFAARYDQINSAQLGASITELDDVGRFIRDHPDAAIPPKIVQALRPDGSVAISLKDLYALARTEFGRINASIDDLQQTVGAINAKQDVLLDYVLDERERRAAQELAEEKAREHRLKLQVAGSAISIISTLAGYIDPDTGKQISVIGSAIVQVAEAYTSWTEAVAGLGTLDAFTSLSTAAMTGNVISAVLNVVSLFGPQQPTPEQMILEEIGKLRQQVSQLRTEMHDRFDRVDEQLNTIYSTMQDRFDRIDLRLGRIDGNIQEIQQTLLRLDMTLSRIERNNFEFLDATNRRPLLNAINGALDYRERTGLDMPYQPDFLAYENDFHSWGTLFAFDPLSAGPTQRDYSDAAVLAELSAYPLDVNINYLNGWLIAHGMQPFASKRLPGPRDWMFASRAYAQLGLEWPEHIAQIKPERQAALDAAGGDLEQAMRAISTRLTPGGPQGNAPLFTELLSYYADRLESVDLTLRATEAALVQERARQLGRSVGFDLYGGLDQPLAYQAPEFSTITCADAADHGSLAAPHNLKNIVPSYNRVVLAEYMQLSTVKVCLDSADVEPRTECFPDPFDPRDEICFFYVKTQAILSVYVDGVAVATRTFTPAGDHLQEVDSLRYIRERWSLEYRPGFEALFAVPPGAAMPPSEAAGRQLAATASALEQTFTQLQQELDRRVRSGLISGGLRDEALKLAGAKKLLESFLALGMPQALQSDDLLRSLLYGNQALVSDQQVAIAYTRPVSATQLTVNPRLALMATAEKRHEALGALLTRYTDAISAKTYSEPIGLINDTRLRMRLALTLAGVEPTSGDTQRRFYLPLLRR